MNGLIRITDGPEETYFNPLLVRFITHQGKGKIRIVFEREHSLYAQVPDFEQFIQEVDQALFPILSTTIAGPPSLD